MTKVTVVCSHDGDVVAVLEDDIVENVEELNKIANDQMWSVFSMETQTLVELKDSMGIEDDEDD